MKGLTEIIAKYPEGFHSDGSIDATILVRYDAVGKVISFTMKEKLA